jgi:hypothetical protein
MLPPKDEQTASSRHWGRSRSSTGGKGGQGRTHCEQRTQSSAGRLDRNRLVTGPLGLTVPLPLLLCAEVAERFVETLGRCDWNVGVVLAHGVKRRKNDAFRDLLVSEIMYRGQSNSKEFCESLFALLYIKGDRKKIYV